MKLSKELLKKIPKKHENHIKTELRTRIDKSCSLVFLYFWFLRLIKIQGNNKMKTWQAAYFYASDTYWYYKKIKFVKVQWLCAITCKWQRIWIRG